jgi:hypothetical protein
MTEKYTEHRIFCEWDAGAYISSLTPYFHAELQKLVESYGPPDKVEFRAHGEGWAEAMSGLSSPLVDDENSCQ